MGDDYTVSMMTILFQCFIKIQFTDDLLQPRLIIILCIVINLCHDTEYLALEQNNQGPISM